MNFAEIYHGFCIIIAIGLTAYCLNQYILDPDVSSITLRKFHESPDDIYPSITLCDKDPFNIGTLVVELAYKQENILPHYSRLIQGEYANHSLRLTQKLQEMDYDNVSGRLNDIVTEFSIHLFKSFDELLSLTYDVLEDSLAINKNEEILKEDVAFKDYNSFKNLSVRISARTGRHKCFTFDLPMISGLIIRHIELKINATWASSGQGLLNLGRFFVMLTYPNQIIQVPRGKKIYLNEHHRNKLGCYRFMVAEGTMEVFKRRDKSASRCNKDWKNQDQRIMNHIIQRAGCNPKHWKIDSELPYCTSAKQYQSITDDYFDSGIYMPPCRSIELFSKSTKGIDPGWRCPENNRYLDLSFTMDEEMYKEITIVPAYNFQSLVGNAG